MKQLLLFSLLSLLGYAGLEAQVVYADYESAGLTFTAGNGVLTAPVANPTANQINGSANCAQYVKSNTNAFSLLIADNGSSFDLSVNNQFKIQVYASAPTQILFKLEGTGGGFEKTKNIAVVNAWQEYTFDFSAQAANTGLSKIVIFFDPGVETSGDTYYFDNVSAGPSACIGVVQDPLVIDDYECNRNATYALGWESLLVVNNPDIDADNGSAKVGEWIDPVGPGTEFAALVIDYQNPLDLTVNNQFSLQVWAPKTGTLLLKIEGGVGAKEVPVQVTEINKWVTYTADFSSEIGKGHNKFVLFFNAGVNGETGDIYYMDNVKLGSVPALEDFQGGVNLGWQALDQNAVLHGVFSGPVANPSPNAVNNSTQVGCYTKGSSTFSALQGISLTNFDLSLNPQFNLDVLSPATGGKVRVQLSSPTQGNKEAEAEITTPGVWETLSFDFSAFSAVTDFGEIRILFNPGTAAAGESWCLDNLRQSKLTINPCVGVIAIPNIIDDYECQRNYSQIFFGGGDLKVVNNPFLTPENASLKVGEYKDPAGAGTEFAGIGIEFPVPIDLSVRNRLSFQVYSTTANVPFLFKLEGGQQFEVFDTLTTANQWHQFDIDFSGAAGNNNTKLVIFTNVLSATGGGTYYFDNMKWQRAGYSGCIVDNETPGLITGWTYFANGYLEATYPFEIINNPNPTGINESAKVGKFVKAKDAAPFAGMYSNPNLEAPIDWKGLKQIKAKVHMDHIGNFAVKVEGSTTGASNIELIVPNTKTNEWEELTFDFSAAPDNGNYQRLTIFFDLLIDATGVDVTSYFDDIIIGAGSCLPSSVFTPTVEQMRIVPNPASSTLWVEHATGVTRLDIVNTFGQRVSTISISNEIRTDIDVARFPAGMYQISAIDAAGRLVGISKFIKQ